LKKEAGMRIFVIRHGSADGGLTHLGREQVQRTADFLKSLELDTSKTALLTSRLRRAVESAEIIQKALNLGEALPISWLTCDTHENTGACLAQFVADHADLTALIAVSHAPEIEQLFYKLSFYGTAHNASVHEVDLQAGTVTCLFVP
jgi:phosphohistidine phosphatase SixA